MRTMTLIRQPSPENILLAARNLKNGALIGLPTETVYGLAADAGNENAVKRIYVVKGRPSDHPLIVHIGSIEYLEKWAIDVPEYALTLAKTFWPGPMTLILKRSEITRDFITGGQESVAIRFPQNEIALSVLKNFHQLGGNGLAAPSANKFGAVSPTDADSVEEDLGSFLDKNRDFILNGGQSKIGVESTIIDCKTFHQPKILRHGAITKQDIENSSGIEITNNQELIGLSFSGGLENHYAPLAKVILNGPTEFGDGFIALAEVETPKNCKRLISPINAEEYAKNLYMAFRLGDRLGLKRIYIELPKGSGIELAIRERVNKASWKG